jgi:hypothetical protein
VVAEHAHRRAVHREAETEQRKKKTMLETERCEN